MVTLDKENLRIWQEQDLEHLRYHSYRLNPSDTVLDIGAYRNEWGNEIKRMYGCHVEVFEAMDNKAAWLFDGRIEMGGAYYYTSMYESVKTASYKCVDIAPYIQKEIALVKINIEGAEYDLLDYIISKGLHKNVRNFQVQFHMVDGMDYETRYKKIAESLSETHEIDWRYPFVWESWKRK